MTMLIKVQIWNNGELFVEDLIPVAPGIDFNNNFYPIVDGNIKLFGYTLRQNVKLIESQSVEKLPWITGDNDD